MDATGVREAVEDGVETELGRLGSSKLLLALTGADLDEPAVCAAVAGRALAGASRLAAWAGEDGPAASLAAEAAAREREAGRALADRCESSVEPTATAVTEFLEECTDEPARAGALLGYALVATRTFAQVVGYYVNEADPAATDDARRLRDESEATVEAAADHVAGLGADERAAALEAATSLVERAYEEYAAALADLGIDPKPVC